LTITGENMSSSTHNELIVHFKRINEILKEQNNAIENNDLMRLNELHAEVNGILGIIGTDENGHARAEISPELIDLHIRILENQRLNEQSVIEKMSFIKDRLVAINNGRNAKKSYGCTRKNRSQGFIDIRK
jgi:hypothetical protein